MKKDEKVKIIKWFIQQYCGKTHIQTEKDNINDLTTLEQLVKDDQTYPHHHVCSTCWWDDKACWKRCSECNDGDKYAFPYGYLEKFYYRDQEKEGA